MPDIVDKSIEILSTGGLGMAMFSLGMAINYQYTPHHKLPSIEFLKGNFYSFHPNTQQVYSWHRGPA